MKKMFLFFMGLLFFSSILSAHYLEEPNLTGKWKLDNIKMVEFPEAGGDSIVIDSKLASERSVAGAFDYLVFNNKECLVITNEVQQEITYVLNGNNLNLNLEAVPHSYQIESCNKNELVLYRTFNDYSINASVYTLRLHYSKVN